MANIEKSVATGRAYYADGDVVAIAPDETIEYVIVSDSAQFDIQYFQILSDSDNLAISLHENVAVDEEGNQATLFNFNRNFLDNPAGLRMWLNASTSGGKQIFYRDFIARPNEIIEFVAYERPSIRMKKDSIYSIRVKNLDGKIANILESSINLLGAD